MIVHRMHVYFKGCDNTLQVTKWYIYALYINPHIKQVH